MKKRLAWFASFLAVLVLAATFFFSLSDMGVRSLAGLCTYLSGGTLTLRATSGSLFGALHIEGLRYADGIDTVLIDTLDLTWDPSKLLDREILIKNMHLSGVRVMLGESEGTTVLPPFSLPVKLRVEEILAEPIAIFSDQTEIVILRTGFIKGLSLQGQTLLLDNLLLTNETSKLTAQGQMLTSNGYPLQLTLETWVQPAGYAPITARSTLQGPLNALILNTDFTAPFPARLKGQLNDLLGDTTWEAQLEGEEATLAKIHPDWPDQQLGQVVLNGRGTLDAYTLDLRLSGGVPQRQEPAELSAAIEGDADGLRVHNLQLRQGKATLSAKGQLLWSPALAWQAEVTGSHLDPSFLFTDWPGDISCTLSTSGQLTGNTPEAAFQLTELQGQLRSYPITGKGEIHLKEKELRISQFILNSGRSVLRVTGTANKALDLSLQLDSGNLAELWPDARGSINARAKLSGTTENPRGELKLTGNKIGLGSTGADKLKVEAMGLFTREGTFEASVTAEQLRAGIIGLDTGRALLQGSLNDHTLTIEGRKPDFTAGLNVHGTFADNLWRGTLNRTHFTSARFGNWQQQQGTAFSLAPDKVEVQPVCLSTPDAGKICLNGSWSAPGSLWQMHGTLASMPLSIAAAITDITWPLVGHLNAVLDLGGQGERVLTGKLLCDSPGMMLSVPLADGAKEHVTWRTNTLRAEYINNQLHTVLESELKENSRLHIDVTLANLLLPVANMNQVPINGSVQLQILDLSPLAVLTEQMVVPAGILRGQFTLQGTTAAPLVLGQMELVEGKAEIPSLGLTLSPLLATIKGDTSMIRLDATAHSGQGLLHAESMLRLEPGGSSLHTLKLSGEDFKAVRLPGLDLDISPDLQILLGKNKNEVSGTVRIPRAHIASVDFYNAITPSSDIYVVDDEQAKDPLLADLPLYTSINLIVGDDVQMNTYGLQGSVTGQIKVMGQPGRPQVGNGTLTVRNGTFTLYGRRLQLDLGRLLFTGGPLTNPGIELRSERKSDKVTTGVIIEGFLQRPEITFYSNPPMDQSAIISNLLENTALGGETRQDTGFLGETVTKVGFGGMVPYLQNLKRLTMIDEIKLETGDKYEDLSLVFGSWLTTDFYVSYGKDLMKESGSFNTRYILGKGFSFSTETGPSQSGGDIKFEVEY